MGGRAKRGVIEAAGGIVWRKSERGAELAVVHRPRHNDWALPKGHLKKGETWQEAALREVEEETGCLPRLEDFAGVTAYLDGGTPKIVLFWNMCAAEECRFEPNHEVVQVAWLSVPEALERLVYENERSLVQEAARQRFPDTFHFTNA